MVDFVLLWVNGNDPIWLEDYARYASQQEGDKRIIRFRDWDNLKYLFRGIEKYAPWVRKVHFVTCGHIPDWLNLDAPKLHFVRHRDFIPNHCLPTFNCNPIELNLHRIEDLSEQFVYFNDDTFLIDFVPENRFFRNGLPCDMAALNVLQPSFSGIDHIQCNDIMLINKYFAKRDIIKYHFGKWFNLKYVSQWYRTAVLLPWHLHTGFVDPHMPNAYLKSTFEKIWELEYEILQKTTESRFRNISNVNQYLMRYWRLCSGEFIPYNIWSDSEFLPIQDNNIDYICDLIRQQRKKIICLNDSDIAIDFDKTKNKLIESFNFIFPEKCSFEK